MALRSHASTEDMAQFGQVDDVELEHGPQAFRSVVNERAAEAEPGIVDEDVRVDPTLTQALLQAVHAPWYGMVMRFKQD